MSTFLRKTTINQSVLALLESAVGPLTEAELRNKLGEQGITAHKTTLYRQLKKLSVANQIESNRFADGVTRYERAKAHHHHVICRGCKRVQDVKVGTHLQLEEQRIAKHVGFRDLTHTLEFYGTCVNCR